MMDCCCTCPTLWFGGSDNTKFTMGSSDHMQLGGQYSSVPFQLKATHRPGAASQSESSCMQMMAGPLHFSLVIGLGAKLVVGVGLRSISIASSVAIASGMPLLFPVATQGSFLQGEVERLIPQRVAGYHCHRGWRGHFLWQNNSKECRSFMSPASSGSSHISPSHFIGSLSFLANALTLTTDTLWGWELNLHCNSANCKMRACVWFSATLALSLQEKIFSFQAHQEDFSLVMCIWSWEIESLSILVFVTLWSEAWRN